MNERVKRVGAALVLVISALPFFQNCAPTAAPSFSAASRSSQEETQHSGSGNGNGYDGKVYVHLLASGVCADGSPVQTRFEMKAQVATLLRENCEDLAPEKRRVIAVSVSSSGLLVYEGVEFTVEQAAPPQPTLHLSHVANQKTIEVSWSGINDQENCVLQNETSAGWATIAAVPCEAQARTTFTLQNLTANWNGQRVRLAGSAGLFAIADFPTTLTCTSRAEGSPTPTPLVDEDCDGNFDNSKAGESFCSTGWVQAPFLAGSTYSLPATRDCNGSVATFDFVWFNVSNNEGSRYSDASCTIFLDIYMGHSSIQMKTPSGTVPNSTNDINSTTCQAETPGGPRWVRYNQAGWTSYAAYYRYTAVSYH